MNDDNDSFFFVFSLALFRIPFVAPLNGVGTIEQKTHIMCTIIAHAKTRQFEMKKVERVISLFFYFFHSFSNWFQLPTFIVHWSSEIASEFTKRVVKHFWLPVSSFFFLQFTTALCILNILRECTYVKLRCCAIA